jgi:hypothetical protein
MMESALVPINRWMNKENTVWNIKERLWEKDQWELGGEEM